MLKVCKILLKTAWVSPAEKQLLVHDVISNAGMTLRSYGSTEDGWSLVQKVLQPQDYSQGQYTVILPHSRLTRLTCILFEFSLWNKANLHIP